MQDNIPVEFQGIRKHTKGDVHEQYYKDHLAVCKYIITCNVCMRTKYHYLQLWLTVGFYMDSTNCFLVITLQQYLTKKPPQIYRYCCSTILNKTLRIVF